MKALRRIGNLLFLVAWVPTEFKGSQAIACAVNVRARRRWSGCSGAIGKRGAS